jgi:hypothetical protein
LIGVFVLVFGAGALAGWWLGRGQASRERAQLTTRGTDAGHETQVPHPPVRPGSVGTADHAAAASTPPGDGDEVIPAAMQEAAAKKRQRKIDERLATLKSRLDLSEAQVTSARPLVEKLIPDYTQIIAKLANDKGGDQPPLGDADFLKILRPPGAIDPEFDQALSALLSPDQQIAYATFQQEQRTNQIEMNANRELARLQGLMTLSPEQKDKVFAVLSDKASVSRPSSRSSLPNSWLFTSPVPLT